MAATTTSKVVQTFRQLARIPSPVSAFARETELGTEVEIVWSQRDLEKKESTKFLKNYLMVPKPAEGVFPRSDPSDVPVRPEVVELGRPVDVSTELWRIYSKSGDRIAILRKCPPSGGDKMEDKQMIEVWNRRYRLATIDVAAQEKHGKVYADDHVFGSFQVC